MNEDYDENYDPDGEYHFDRDEEDVLHNAWLMPLEEDYTEVELTALREMILENTRYGTRALDVHR